MYAPVRKRYVDGRWGQVHLRMAGGGEKPPLLMLHPTPKSGWIYEPLLSAMGMDRIALAPDTPGYGASDAPPAPVEIPDYADEMLAVIDRLCADGTLASGRFDVLGYHTGSVIAASMAERFPDRVRRVVMVSLPVYSAQARAQKLAGLESWPQPDVEAANVMAMWQRMQRLFDPRLDIAWKQESLVENLRCGSRAPWAYASVYRHDLAATLANVRQPALVLNPEDDLWHQTREGAAHLPHARLEELPGVGHGLFALERDRIAAILRHFLDD
jgi:pimeloyl-ACP methyl ester carboxylesterase